MDHLAAWQMPLGYALALLRAASPELRDEDGASSSIWDAVEDEPLTTESGFTHSPGMSKLMRMMGKGKAT